MQWLRVTLFVASALALDPTTPLIENQIQLPSDLFSDNLNIHAKPLHIFEPPLASKKQYLSVQTPADLHSDNVCGKRWIDSCYLQECPASKGPQTCREHWCYCATNFCNQAGKCVPSPQNTTILHSNDPRLHYFGRHLVGNGLVQFDWIGTGVSLQIDGGHGTVSVDMDGGHGCASPGCRFAVYREGVQVGDFRATGGRRWYKLAVNVTAGDIISLTRTSEGDTTPKSVASLYSVGLTGPTAGPFTATPRRRIAVYGDSDSAAYGVDVCDTNFAHGWVTDVAAALDARASGVTELHVQAVSGVGVAMNALGGIACSTTVPLSGLIGRTLQGVKEADWDFALWRPDIVVVYAGSNDYINVVPPSEEEFKAKYSKMVSTILAPWTKAKPPVVHVCGYAGTPCNYIQEMAQQDGSVYVLTGDHGSKRTCGGHRNTTQQAALAKILGPIIATAAGWDNASNSLHGGKPKSAL